MSGEAEGAEHNGDIWSSPSTKHDAIWAEKIEMVLSVVSINFWLKQATLQIV